MSFVGSTPIARHVYETGTAHGKRVQALGGAKNHMVVLPDADIDVAADAAVSAAYGSAGERCMAISVVVAVGDVARRAGRRDRGAPAEAAHRPRHRSRVARWARSSPREHRDRVASYVDSRSRRRRARRGRRSRAAIRRRRLLPRRCRWSTASGPACRCYDDEIFGPVLAVVRADTYDEAVRLVNDNPYGNGAAIFTRDGGAARRFQFDVSCGMVGVNVPDPGAGRRTTASAAGRRRCSATPHMYGPDGIDFYTRTKVVTSRWPDPATSAVDLGFPRTR